GIDDVAHVRAAWIGENAAVAERAGAPFHPSLEPPDNSAVGDLPGGPHIERPAIGPRPPLDALLVDRRALAVETLGNLTVGEFRTPVAVLEDEIARPGPALVPRGQRSAE